MYTLNIYKYMFDITFYKVMPRGDRKSKKPGTGFEGTNAGQRAVAIYRYTRPSTYIVYARTKVRVTRAL